MTNAPTRQEDDQLRVLSIFHYVVGGFMILAACVPIIHLVIGLAMVLAPERLHASPEQVPKFLGLLFMVMSAFVILAGWTLGGLVLYAGHCLSQRKYRTFCLVIAGLMCLFMPLGTILGVFTIVVLMKPSVEQQFASDPYSS